ncbi:MAG TPA: hypothetical protein VF944_05670, partial [Candidatus Bathyarchaeia archaeon]
MQRQLPGNRRVTLRGHQYEMVFDPNEASPPPVRTPSPPMSPATTMTTTQPAWAIQLEHDLARIQQQAQEEAAQMAQQQRLQGPTIEEVDDNVEDETPSFYVDSTPQLLTEAPAFPGHYQIEFPGEQILGETNSDVSDIDDLEPPPIPRDMRPSGFAMPPLPPRQRMPPPPPRPQPFPEPSFRSWLVDTYKRKELIDQLEVNAPPIASQLDIYTKMKSLQLQTMRMRTEIIDMKKQMREEVQHRERMIDTFGERLQTQQNLFDGLAARLLDSIPRDELRFHAPAFFHDNTNDQNMDEGICPITLEEFHVQAPDQIFLFYSQGAAKRAVYKGSTRKFYSKHIPREEYRESKCKTCRLYGHIQWNCIMYVC